MSNLAIRVLIVCSVLVWSSNGQTVGTVLPRLTQSSQYRVFNDLLKQSNPFVPYQYDPVQNRSWRVYNVQLSIGQNLYPSQIVNNIIAVAEINFIPGVDSKLVSSTYNVSFQGDGRIEINQSGLSLKLNTTVNTGTFVLKDLSTLRVYIYQTNPSNLVRDISITPVNDNSTFTQDFLNSVQNFQMIRYCFWQGENTYISSNTPLLWDNRATPRSATQIGPYGIAIEHAFELAKITNSIPWICIPSKADDNYIQNLGTLANTLHDMNKQLFVEYGNVYTVMNDIADYVVNPKFALFLQYFGLLNRSKVSFTLNYSNIQYFINAIGMRTTPVDYTYINYIGVDTSFGDALDVTNAYGLSDSQLKNLLVDMELTKELLVNRAYKLAKKIGKELISFGGGPTFKVPRYGWRFKYYTLKQTSDQNKIYADQEAVLSTRLKEFNANPFVKDIFIEWLNRLSNIGLKVLSTNILIDSYTEDRDFVPLLESITDLNRPLYQGALSYISRTYTSILSQNISLSTGDNISSSLNYCNEGNSGIPCSPIPDYSNCNTFIGTNLNGQADWSTQLPYVDMMKMSRDWIVEKVGEGWGSGESLKSTITFDSNRYPTSLPDGLIVVTLMARDLISHYDKGTYIVLYDGDGALNFSMDDIKAVRQGYGRIEVDVVPTTNFNNGIALKIERTNPKNPVRNIRVIRPGFENIYNKVTFHPLFLNQIKPFRVLRFMDWTNTNAQADTTWNKRVLPSFRTNTINGVPWEDVIKLGNLMKKDVWINIPHLADDNYIQQLATLFYGSLLPDLKVYVEYSNEVWGTLFPGGKYAQEQGILSGFSTDPTQARFCYLGYMTQKISNIWKTVYQDRLDKLVIVVSTQSVNADTTKRILECRSTYKFVDAVAVAPYVSFPMTDTMNVDNAFNVQFPAALRNIDLNLKAHLAWTSKYNLMLLNYEGGQGLVGSTTNTLKLSKDIQYDARIKNVYRNYFNILKYNQVSLTMIFTDICKYTQYGVWGSLEFYDQNPVDHPKYSGIVEYIKQDLSCVQPPVGFGACTKNCNNRGVCYHDKCFCYANSSGDNCENFVYTDFVDCGYKCTFDQGVCSLSEIIQEKRYFKCTCNPGYIGAYCAIPVCTGECSYNGECVAPEKCTCFQGRKGQKCEIDCKCNGHGTCDSNSNMCICDPGFAFNNNNGCQLICTNSSDSPCAAPNSNSCNPNCKYGTCNNGVCNCWPGYSGSSCDVPAANPKLKLPLGINMASLSYWSTEFAFKNYFYLSSSFISQYYPNYYSSDIQYTWNTNKPINTDSSGYPLSLTIDQKVGKLLLRDIQLKYPKGNQFILLYDGEGVIDLAFDAKITRKLAGRIEFAVTPSVIRDNGVYVQIYKTNPSNPIKNIRIVQTADEYNYNQDLLTPNFVKFLSQFSTIRFMDFLHTNGNPVAEISDSPGLNDDTQTSSRGASIDLLIKLANRAGNNVWINIPHKASDNYVANIAQKLKNTLSGSLKIFVEYSNEVWNSFFEQGKYAIEQAKLLGLANAHIYYAKRSSEIFDIFNSTFGDASSQLVFVVSAQFVNSWTAQQILSYNGLAQKAHVLAIAPYFDCNSIGNSTNAALYAVKTVDDILTRCETTLNTLDSYLSTYQNLAASFQIKLTAYEAGTSMSEQQTIYNGSETNGLTAKFIEANQNIRMKGIYKNYLYKLKQFGLMKDYSPMLFSSIGLPSKYGSWGVLDYTEQVNESPSHPKFEAIKEFNLENPV